MIPQTNPGLKNSGLPKLINIGTRGETPFAEISEMFGALKPPNVKT